LSSPPEFEGARILIVDESTNVRFLQNLLGKNGYAHLSSTSDVRSAIGICHDNPPDLVLLDMNRPQMNGVGSA
jgi:putative two-component system response regulator